MLDEISDQNRFHLKNLAFAFEVGALGKNRFRRALGEQLPLAPGSFHNDRHHPARKVEGNFVHLGVFLERQLPMQFLVLQDRAVEDVFQAGLKMADQIGVAQHLLVFVFEHVAIDFQDDVIQRERARLVGAQHVHRPKVLNRVQPLDDDLFPGHAEGALRKADRHDHRQHFRRQAHRHRQREEERFVPVMFGEAVNGKDQRDHDQHEPDHQPREFFHPALESCFHGLAGEAPGDLAKIGLRAGAEDNTRGRAALDARAQETQVCVFDR